MARNKQEEPKKKDTGNGSMTSFYWILGIVAVIAIGSVLYSLTGGGFSAAALEVSQTETAPTNANGKKRLKNWARSLIMDIRFLFKGNYASSAVSFGQGCMTVSARLVGSGE